MSKELFFYAEYLLDGTMLAAYKNMSRLQFIEVVGNYNRDVLVGFSTHTAIFGREKDLNKLGSLGNLIRNNAKDYNDRKEIVNQW